MYYFYESGISPFIIGATDEEKALEELSKNMNAPAGSKTKDVSVNGYTYSFDYDHFNSFLLSDDLMNSSTNSQAKLTQFDLNALS